MSSRPPVSTLTDSRCPDTSLFRSSWASRALVGPLSAGCRRDAKARRVAHQVWVGPALGVQVTRQGEAFEANDQRSQNAANATDSEQTRSEEHTSELQSLMRSSYAVFCLKKKTKKKNTNTHDSTKAAARHIDNRIQGVK